MQIDTPRPGMRGRAPALLSGTLLSSMSSRTEDLEEELRRNFKLRRELGAEIRLELLTTDTADKKDANYLRTLTRFIGAAWITVGLIALALAAFIIAIRVA